MKKSFLPTTLALLALIALPVSAQQLALVPIQPNTVEIQQVDTSTLLKDQLVKDENPHSDMPLNPIPGKDVVNTPSIKIDPEIADKVKNPNVFIPDLKPVQPIFPSLPEDPKLPNPIDPMIPIPQFPALPGAPKIKTVSVNANTEYVLVKWTTDVKAKGQINYGETTAYTGSLADNNVTSSHALLLPASGLKQLHLKITAIGVLGKKTTTEDMTINIPKKDTPTASSTTSTATNNDTKTTNSNDEALNNKPNNEANLNPNNSNNSALNKDLERGNAQNNPQNLESNGIDTTTAILGGIIIILIGFLFGYLISQAGKKKD